MEGVRGANYLGKPTICFITGPNCPLVKPDMPQNPNTPANTPATLLALIERQVAKTKRRVSRIEYEGRIIWIKQQEKLSLRMRLQKGDAKGAFVAERAAMRLLHDVGVPVPAIVAEGPDYFATVDSGLSLKQLLRGATGRRTGHSQAFEAAGKQLALMHAKNLSHGRPSIKDICWQNGRITFLDFERFHAKRNTPKGHMQDLVMAVFSTYAVTGADCPEVEALIKGYRSHDPDDIWQAAVRWCGKMRWVDYLTKPIQWRGAGKAREFKAIPLTLDAFARDRPL